MNGGGCHDVEEEEMDLGYSEDLLRTVHTHL